MPATRSDLPYDPFTDLAPISLTLIKPAMLLVKPELPIRNFEEYVAHARTNPGKLNFGTTGMGGAYHSRPCKMLKNRMDIGFADILMSSKSLSKRYVCGGFLGVIGS